MPLSEPDDSLLPLLDWCRAEIGACRIVSEHSHTHGESRVWRVVTESGEVFYLKQHRRPDRWRQEFDAYIRYAFALGAQAPHLIAARMNTPHALLVSALNGVAMASITLTPDQEQAAWEFAGRCLARLHTLPAIPADATPNRIPDAVFTDAGRYLAERIEMYLERGKAGALFSPDEIAFARAMASQVRSSGAFDGETPVPCHRDYSPRNWIVSPGDGIWRGVIDWEMARPDLRVNDFCRWWDIDFLHRPDLEAAFFRGYGRLLTQRERLQTQYARVSLAVGTVAWAFEHGDAPFRAKGHEALRRITDTRIHPQSSV